MILGKVCNNFGNKKLCSLVSLKNIWIESEEFKLIVLEENKLRENYKEESFFRCS